MSRRATFFVASISGFKGVEKEDNNSASSDVRIVNEIKEVLPELVWSSSERDWQGFKVERFHHSLRKIEPISHPFHVIIFYIGEPSFATGKCDRIFFKSQQRRGSIEIVGGDCVFEAEFDGNKNDDIFMQLEPEFFASVAAQCDLNPDRIELTSAFPDSDPRIEAVGLGFQAELESQTPAPRIYGESLAVALAAHLLQNYTAHNTAIRQYRGGLPKYKLNRVIEFINANLDQDVSLETLSAVASISSYYFVRLFKQSVGISPHQYVLQQRLQRARELLLKTDLPINEISLQTGFSNQSHFTAAFRRFLRVTPSHFRKSK